MTGPLGKSASHTPPTSSDTAKRDFSRHWTPYAEYNPRGIDSGHARNFEDAKAKAQAAAILFIAAGRPQNAVRKFSAAGPCLTQGRYLGETEHFVFYLDGASKRRLRKTPGFRLVHTEACERCGGTYND